MDIRKTYARNDVDINYTWNLKDLFASNEDIESALSKGEKLTNEFIEKYKGNLNTAEIINDSIKDLIINTELLNKIGTYSYLLIAEDTTNGENMKYAMGISNKLNQLNVKLSFYENEILKNDIEVLNNVIELDSENKVFIDDLIRTKSHMLTEDGENVLSALSINTGSFRSLYESAKLQDMKFPNFIANNEEHELSYNIFEGVTDNSQDNEIRRNSFRIFSDKIEEYKNVTARIYLTHCQTEKAISKLRGFDSVIDYLLFNQNVDRELYNRQIDLIMKYLSPIMRRYASLLKKVHNLEEMRYEDLKMELDYDFDKNVTVDEAKKIILEGLSVLGEDYTNMIERAFDERWIDFVNNTGKSTGAFCSSPYGVHPFILISWTGKMTETMVLSHELGHAGHFYNAQKAQHILNTRPSLYFIEAPSTTNELIMANTLVNNAKDPKERRYYLSQIISRTYYHNFVTHLLEAAYQREVYNFIDNGIPFGAEDLSNIYKQVLVDFWGEDIILTKGAELTWMRQPHYYMGLYPYTYSAGLTIGTEVSQNILKEGKPAVDRWIDTLKLGGTKDVIELAQNAGVDITTDAPLMNAINYIGSIVDELEALTKELEG